MSRNALIAVIAGAVVVVAALAAITPTVLVDEHHERGTRVMRFAAPFALNRVPLPLPGPGFRRDLDRCLRQHGATPGKTFPPGTFRECMPKLAPALPGSSG